MSSTTDSIRTLALAVLVLVAATGVGAAGTGATLPRAQQAHQSDDADGSLSVHVSVTANGTAITADYEGDGVATMTVSGVDGTYSGAGTWSVDGSQTVDLPAPTDAAGVEAVVETANLTVERTIEFSTVRIDCGPITIERTVPTAVTYGFTATGDGETHSDAETVDIPVDEFECPTATDSSTIEDQFERVNERLADVREDVHDRRSTAIESDGSRVSGEDRHADDAGESAEDGASPPNGESVHDEVQGTEEDGPTGDESSPEVSGDATDEVSGDATDEIENHRSDGRERDAGLLSTMVTLTDRAGDDSDRTGNETGRDAEIARRVLTSVVQRMLGTAGDQAGLADTADGRQARSRGF